MIQKIFILFCVLFSTLAAADEFVWIEAESPSAHSGLTELKSWEHQYFSGKWLHISVDADKLDTEINSDAITLKYEFDAPAEKLYEIWNRVGFEYVRSPFDWRIDDGEWTTAQPDDLTIDLMEVGFWCEIAWLKLGQVQLAKGGHTLEIRLQKRKNAEGKPERILYASDCLCLYPGEFKPYSKYKPNENHQTEKDVEAARRVLKVPRSGSSGIWKCDLSGTWEICRDDEYLPEPVTQPISRLPETTRWSAIQVPGDKNTLRPDLMFAHRVWYRTKIGIMFKDASIDAAYIEFPQNNLNTTVYVNGKLCGFNKNPFAKFHIDISKAIKPGINEIYVGIRDAWYAFTEKADDPMKLRRKFNLPKKFFEDGFQDLVYPIWHHPQSGILVAPVLHLVNGPVYIDDVFVKPSVINRELAVDVAIKNTSDNDQTVELFCKCLESRKPLTVSSVKLFTRQNFTVKANSETVVQLKETWENPRFWTPDDPHIYLFECFLYGNRKNAIPAYTSTKTVEFGFREWSIDGKDFLLNGVPYRAWADCFEQATPENWLQFYRDTNQKAMRFCGVNWKGLPPEDALNFFDKNGVVVRRSEIFDGQRIGYNVIENDPQIRAKNKAVDPTSSSMVDGGGTTKSN